MWRRSSWALGRSSEQQQALVAEGYQIGRLTGELFAQVRRIGRWKYRPLTAVDATATRLLMAG